MVFGFMENYLHHQYIGLAAAWGGRKEGGIVMELIPWKPFGDVGLLRRETDDLWNRFLGKTPVPGAFTEEWSPLVDISETNDNFVVKAELPGLESKDVNVSVSGDILTIKGEKKKEKEEKDEHHHYVERYEGSFQRTFQLPSSIKGDKVEANFDKGVLNVTLPKVEEAKKRQIEIKVK